MTDFLGPAVATRPDAPAADDGARRWSFAELSGRADRAADLLAARGAAPGRVVVLDAEPSLDLLAALHGAFRTGALVAPLHPDLTPPEREAALGALRPAVIVGEGGLPPASLVGGGAGGSHRHHPRSGSAGSGPDGPAAVLWTSGTSGRPRGVLLGAAGLRASAEGSRVRLGLRPADVWYAALSPAHVGGLALLVRSAVIGCAVMVRGRFSAGDLSALIDAGRVSHASLVPTMLLRLLEARGDRPPPPSLRCLLIGGAHAPGPLVARALAAGLPVALTYGLTEATSQVTTAPPDEVRADPTSVGRALPGVEVEIGADGEILVWGATVSPGRFDGGPLTDDRGRLHTGDLGELDETGRLRVVGRRSDRIVTGGATVDAHEVEVALRAHPAVADACVVGLPDDTWGERVAAAVVSTGEPVEADAFDAWLQARLSPAKRPRTVRFVEALPRNPNGKVDRTAVRRSLADL